MAITQGPVTYSLSIKDRTFRSQIDTPCEQQPTITFMREVKTTSSTGVVSYDTTPRVVRNYNAVENQQVTLVNTGTFTISVAQLAEATSLFSDLWRVQDLTPVVSQPGQTAVAVGVATSIQVSASNTPTSWSATGLPTGLSMDPVTGVISGTSSAAGTFSAVLTATNWYGSGSLAVTFTAQ